MYKTIVMDGDCADLPALKKLQPYDDQLPEKVECGGHLSKNAYTEVTNFGRRWTVERGRKYEQDRLGTVANTEVQAQAARRKEVRKGGGGPVLARAAAANLDQRSVKEFFASEKPSKKRKASEVPLPPNSEVSLPKRAMSYRLGRHKKL